MKLFPPRRALAITALGLGVALAVSSCSSGGGGGDATQPAGGGGGGGAGSSVSQAANPSGATGSATASEVKAAMDSLYAAAKKNKQSEVVVYGIEDNTCYDQFSKQFPGIKVKSQYMLGETVPRVEQEHVSKRQVADMLRTGSTAFLQLAKEKLMEQFVPVSARGLNPAYFGPDNTFIASGIRANGIIYNTDRLSAADAPKSWDDLTKPKYKGMIVMSDPGAPGSGESVLEQLMATGHYDMDWVKELAKNKIVKAHGGQPAISSVKSGENAIDMAGIDQVTGPPLEKSAPIKFLFPLKGATPMTAHYTGIIAGAPHMDAAKLLETWLVSKEGQSCLTTQEGDYPVRSDVDPPAGLPALADLPNPSFGQKAIGFDELDTQVKLLGEFKKIFK